MELLLLIIFLPLMQKHVLGSWELHNQVYRSMVKLEYKFCVLLIFQFLCVAGLCEDLLFQLLLHQVQVSILVLREQLDAEAQNLDSWFSFFFVIVCFWFLNIFNILSAFPWTFKIKIPIVLFKFYRFIDNFFFSLYLTSLNPVRGKSFLKGCPLKL